MPLELMYITNDPKIALIAERAGVDRIWIDLETIGKEERQKGLNSVKSHHSISDINTISHLLTYSKMQVRINPWNEMSEEEIDSVISAGAEYIMLPMWKTLDEVKKFINYVGRRVKTILLLETKEAENCLDDVLKLNGIDEIHIGLNDLHLSYNLTFMFELLSNGTVERICSKLKQHNIKFGFGGFSHLGDGMLPAEMIITEHYRIESKMAILSRGFCNTDSNNFEKDFCENVKRLREFEKEVSKLSYNELLVNKSKLDTAIMHIVKEMKNGK